MTSVFICIPCVSVVVMAGRLVGFTMALQFHDMHSDNSGIAFSPHKCFESLWSFVSIWIFKINFLVYEKKPVQKFHWNFDGDYIEFVSHLGMWPFA